MLGKIEKFVSELVVSLIAACILYGIAGLCLGLGALGLDYFRASVRVNFGG